MHFCSTSTFSHAVLSMPLKQRVQAFDAIKLTYTKFYDLINPCQSSTIGAGKHLSKTTQTIAAVSLSHIAKLRSHSDHKFAIFLIRRASIFCCSCSRSCSARVHLFHSLCGQSCFHSHPRQPTSGSDWLLHTNLPSTIARALSTSCFFLQKAEMYVTACSVFFWSEKRMNTKIFKNVSKIWIKKAAEVNG